MDAAISRMRSARVGFGLVAAAFGTAWLAGGPGVPGRSLHYLAIGLPTAVLALGLVNLLRLAVPRGALAGPVTLIGVGGAGVAVADHLVTARLLAELAPSAIIVAGGLVAMSEPQPGVLVDTGVVRCTAFFWIRRPLKLPETPPDVIVVRVFFGCATIDLSGTKRQKYVKDDKGIALQVTALFGRVTVRTGKGWRTKPGRLDLAYAVRFDEPKRPSKARGSEPGPLILNVQGGCSVIAVEH